VSLLKAVAGLRAAFWERVEHWALSRATYGSGTSRLTCLVEAEMRRLLRVIKALPASQPLIIFDTFACCFEGGDENSGKDMGKALAAEAKFRKETGAATLFLDHTNASPQRERGHSSKRNSADLMAERVENDQTCKIY